MATQTKGQSRSCGDCVGCRQPNCNACKYCMDHPRNGGKHRLRKRCLLRVCVNKVSPPFCRCLWFDHCCSHSPFTQPILSAAKFRAQRRSASSAGLKRKVKPKQGNIGILPSMSGEHREPSAVQWTPMDTESKHTAVVMVDDPDNLPKRQKILPKKLTSNAMEFLARKPRVTANANPESHFGKKTLMMTAGGKIGGVRKTRSETSSRTLRHRSGRQDAGA